MYLIDVINTFERVDDIKYTLNFTTDGTITADEVTYAGGMTNTANKLYYLYDNAQSYYWSLSRSTFIYSTTDRAFYVFSDGDLNYTEVGDSGGVRPAVTLATGAQISSGDGTIGNSYKILEN